MGAKFIAIHAQDIDEVTRQQFEHCASQPYVTAAALMPDAHAGYVAPIGAVLISEGFVVPAWVGYDIGCGLIAVKLSGEDVLAKCRERREEIYERVRAVIPMGMGNKNAVQRLSPETREEFRRLVERFAAGPHDKNILQFFRQGAEAHLGTLGGGNHFIELDEHEGEAWLVIHSGSRGVGYKVAQKYMQKSAGRDWQFEETHPLAVDSQLGREYLNILSFGLDFALLNRLEMSTQAVKAIRDVIGVDVQAELWTNKTHNHALLEDGRYIHRKGATPAKKGERGVIPGNMRDGSFLVEGLGNKEFLESSSHGAGRAYSRAQARKQFSLAEFRESMQGIVGTVEEGTLDEVPMAYKDIFAVMEAQKESVRVVAHLTPLINWKGIDRKGKRDEID